MEESAVELLASPEWHDRLSALPEAELPGVTLLICFPNERCAEYLIAGIPAAARAVQAVACASDQQPIICSVTSGEWAASHRCRAESLRLAQSAPFAAFPHGETHASVLMLDGMGIITRISTDPALHTFANLSVVAEFELASPVGPLNAAQCDALLRQANRAFLRATGKKEDGLVSRYLNRPISRSISALLLRLAQIRPWHATIGTALLAVLMLAAFIVGGSSGAVAGAVLFHAASVFDGVDGEIARATQRTSATGARLDSLIDAATNLAFLGGLAFNLYARGQEEAAVAGLIGIVVLLSGLLQIGSRSQSLGQPINFEAVKVALRRGKPNSLLTNILIWITMRDFIAATCAAAVVLGFAAEILFLFMLCAIIWLVSITVILARTRSSSAQS